MTAKKPHVTASGNGRAKIEYVALSDLKGAARNPKGHDLGAIHQSIARFGFTAPLLMDERTGRLVAGHGRLAVLHQMREADESPPARIVAKADDWMVPIVRGVDSDDDAEAYLIADNRLTELGGWDDALLLEALQDLAKNDALDGTGYDGDDIDALIAQLETELQAGNTDPDAIPDVPTKPQTKPGDVWQLGPHRILCGDCRDAATMDRLLDGATVNLAFTSPPYSDHRKYDEDSGFKPIHPDNYVEWFDAVQANVAAHLAEDGSWFVNIKSSPGAEVLDTELYVFDLVLAHVRRWGWHFATEFCWERTGVPKEVTRRFKNQFEPVYQFSRGSWKMRPHEVQHRSDNVVMSLGPGSGSGFKLSDVQGTGGASLFRAQAPIGSGMAFPGNRLPTFSGSHTATGHTAAFPVGLPEFFIKAYTDEGDAILDPFMGSGSTLIAAHMHDRTCYGMEISPGYCDVIVKRWEDFTGDKAVLADPMEAETP